MIVETFKIQAVKIIAFLYFFSCRFLNKVLKLYYLSQMEACGKQLKIDTLCSKYAGLENFKIGDNVNISHGSTFYSTEARLVIGDNVIFGPNTTIITGDHRIDYIGKSIANVNEKLPANDKDVIIEDDVWCGANVTILKGVTIGRGSVVAAGAVLTKSCPPYSIVMGVPAKVKAARFTIEEILKHEQYIYPPEKRLKINDLRQMIWGGSRLITSLLKSQLYYIGKIGHRSNFHLLIEKGRLMIGNDVFFNHNVSVTCLNEIVIEDKCTFGNNVVIVDHDHNHDNTGFLKGRIRIGMGTWVGANVVILRNSIIGKNCIIAAGSIVKGYVPDNTLYFQKKETEYRSR